MTRWEDIRKEYVSMMAKISRRFKSGNRKPSVAHITAAEWDLIDRYECAAEHLSTTQAMSLSDAHDLLRRTVPLIAFAFDNGIVGADELGREIEVALGDKE